MGNLLTQPCVHRGKLLKSASCSASWLVSPVTLDRMTRARIWTTCAVLSSIVRALHGQNDSVRFLTEVPATGARAGVFAVFLSGDGGWAELDKSISARLARAGIPVVGIDSRAYLKSARKTPDLLAADLARIVAQYRTKWGLDSFALIGYSRGAVLVPFAAARFDSTLKAQLRLIAMLGLEERAGFTFHFTDLLSKHSPKDGLPVLPELERLRGISMLCVYGRDEEESLCRSVDSTLVTRFVRDGGHHLDGNYPAIAQTIIDHLAIGRADPERRTQ